MRALAFVCLLSSIAFAHEPEEAGGLRAPVLVERAEPAYPEAALAAGVGGTVELELSVGADGRVSDVQVRKAAGFGLDEAAAAAARRFRFQPATRDGKAIASTVLFDQSFVARPHFSSEVTAAPSGSVTAAPSPAPSLAAPTYESVVQAEAPTLAASATTVRDRDFAQVPRGSPTEILRAVPGLITAQHQGGGKADQLFLRGFDADHGTDVAVFVDGVPVNLPSHAHGQGYVDLHFIIPELVEKLDVEKGPYDARYGDFATAGVLNLETRDRAQSQVGFTLGGFPGHGCSGGIYRCQLVAQERLVGIVAPSLPGWAQKIHPIVAAEIARDQGPFDSPEKLYRYNVFLKLIADLAPSTHLGISLSAYGSGWNGSGQIPSRLVDNKQLSEWGSLDPSEGGLTERQQLSLFFHHHSHDDEIDVTFWIVRYRLRLWNDFTFFLEDPINGDEIEQDDARTATGGFAAWHHHTRWRGISFRSTVGAQVRWDGVHVDLFHDTDRQRLGRFLPAAGFGAGDDITQSNLGAFVELDVNWTRWLRTVAGVRADWFGFDVSGGSKQKTLVSPKLSVVFLPARWLDLFLNFGMGFHSNDARVAVESGAVTADGSKIQAVPRIYAGEFGARFRWGNRGTISAALWASYLENETVFDADAATYVPADPSRRWGVDVDLRAHPVDWLTLDFELAQASAEALRPDGQTAGLALAPRLYATGGVTASWRGLGAGLRFRYLGARPAFDSDTPEYRGHPIDTDPYVVFDAWVAYRWRWLEAELGAQNLFDRDWREAQVGNRSCTRDETYNPNSTHYGSCASILAPPDRVGVPDVHFTPGVPFNLQLTLRVYF